MEGCWRGPLGDAEGDFVEERYGPPAGDLVLGTVAYVRAGRATQHEFIEIRADGDGGVTLLPYPGGRRSEHAFHLTSGDGTHAVFEAPEHDYPKRIVYRAVGPDGLEGATDAGADDDAPRRWPMRRVACEEVGASLASERSPTGLADFRRHLAWLTADGASWMTPNPGAQGGVEAYGMWYGLVRGGAGAVGCLWGESGGEVVGVYWDFFQAWDPVRGRALVYQSGPGGDIGIGEETRRQGPEGETVQTFVWSDGSSLVQKHVLREAAPDTFVTESLNLAEGEWVPAGTFTWTRTRGAHAPCGTGSPG
jgi:hypothetical protein